MQRQMQPQRQWAYLVNAANEMQMLSMGDEPEPENMVKAARMGCNAMQQLENDQHFFEAVALLGTRQQENNDAFQHITRDLDHLRYFLQVEREVMLKAGMSQQLIDTLMKKIDEVITLITQWRADAERLRGGLQSIRYQACRLSDSMERSAREAERVEKQETIEKTKRQLPYVIYAVGGAAIVMLNVSPIAAQLGLTAPGTAVSGAVGSALISAAIPGPNGW